MDETRLGTILSKPMSNEQRRAHRRLAAAEKRLIHLITWEAPADQIDRAERRCKRATAQWKQVCS